MADTQTAPAGVTPGARDVPVPGPLASSDEIDLADATQGFLNLMDPRGNSRRRRSRPY